MFENTIALCDSFLKMGIPFYDVLVYRDGKEIFRHMNGYTNLEEKTPVRGDELLNIYSCSKPITVTAALQLWEKGLFQIEDELSKYLPEFEHMTVRTEDGVVPATKPITIRNIFTMTAGFNYDLRSPSLLQLREDTEGRCPTREFARYLAKEPLMAEPGTEYRYSLGHDVLAALVEVISGEKFEVYVKKNIFDPMGMTRSDFLKSPETYEEVTTLYGFKDGKAELRPKMPTYRVGTEHASGGAGCVSTVEDYMKFLEGLRTFKLLKAETIEFLTRDWLTEQEKQTYPQKAYNYGLGMRSRKPGGIHADFGWGGAAGAYLGIDIPHGISIFYVQHLLSSPNHSIRARVYTAVLQDLGFDVKVELPDPGGLTY